MNISVRKAGREDIDAMSGLLAQLFTVEADFDIDETKQKTGLAMFIGDPGPRCAMVAEDGCKVIGMVTGQLLASTAEGSLSALVEDLVVEMGYQGKGIGAHLLGSVEEWARGAGATRLQLLADKDNGPAEKFYTAAGWTKTNLMCLRKTESGTTLCPGMKSKGA